MIHLNWKQRVRLFLWGRVFYRYSSCGYGQKEVWVRKCGKRGLDGRKHGLYEDTPHKILNHSGTVMVCPKCERDRIEKLREIKN